MGCGASTGAAPPVTEAVVEAVSTNAENSNSHIADKMAATAATWKEMMAKASPPASGAAWNLMFIADQDQASKVEGGWETHLAAGKLVYNGDKGENSYSLTMGKEATLVTTRGDKSGAARSTRHSRSSTTSS